MASHYGSCRDPTHRDLNPAVFHLALANIMRKLGRPVILDIDANAPVWNYPVRSYKIRDIHLIPSAAAAKRFFGATSYPFKMQITWVNDSKQTQEHEYEYVLELDDQDQIIGGEWIGDSKTNHPDFLWSVQNQPRIELVTSIGLRYADIRELLDTSIACENVGSLAPEPMPTPTVHHPL